MVLGERGGTGFDAGMGLFRFIPVPVRGGCVLWQGGWVMGFLGWVNYAYMGRMVWGKDYDGHVYENMANIWHRPSTQFVEICVFKLRQSVYGISASLR